MKIRKQLTKVIGSFVPQHIKDPSLIIRMIRSRDSSAWFTISLSIVAILAIPLDWVLSLVENKVHTRNIQPKYPIIIICGVPRSGTTLVSQVLISQLPVNYITNLTALFPKSPIIANRLFGKFLRRTVSYNSYYGKTASLSGPNDAFFIWDRWLREDVSGIRCVLDEEKTEDMIHFFGNYQGAFNLPLLLKNNSLNTHATPIARALGNAYFICMTRQPAYVAQSLIEARIEIQGDVEESLWVNNPDKSETEDWDYIEDICDQVLYHERMIVEQQQRIGKDRYWIVEYEEFVGDPNILLQKVCDEILNIQFHPLERIKSFTNSNRIRISLEEFDRIEKTLRKLGVN